MEQPKLHSTTKRKARKHHGCCECHGPIDPGDHYIYGKGLNDGGWYSYKLCLSCDEWSRLTGVADDGWILGDLAYVIAELFNQGPHTYYVDPDAPVPRWYE
jgi:hypothetical protein